MSDYDRMNPDSRLLQKLNEYSKINYGVDAYALSGKEAEFIVNTIKRLELKIKVLKDNQLRTYDGLAEKADKYDKIIGDES